MKYAPKYLLPAAIALSCVLAAPVYAADTDSDGVDDAIDNCLGKSNTDQRDTDGDGFGNRCDGDLNNDGKTNSLDLGLFKKKLGTSNPDADFNGDGIVNAADTSLLQQLSQKVPGPTAIKTDPELADNPPEVDAMDTAELDSPLADGRNAAFFVKFKTTPDKKAIVILENDKPVALNDIGVSPDQVAEDGVFSGYSSVDFADLQQKEKRLAEQIAKIPNPTITNFSGRSVIGTEPFKPTGMKSVFLDTSIPIGLNPVVLPNLDSPILPLTFDPYKVLAITDPAVIADPNLTGFHCNLATLGPYTYGNINGPWSFKTLMSNMTGSTNPAVHKSFITNWLKKWTAADTVNGYTINPRPHFDLMFPGLTSPTALVDIDKLPFQLLAIINRMDLGKSSLYGRNNKPGETRFVFGLLDPGNCSPKPMTVILEYSDPIGSCPVQQARANSWLALDNYNLNVPSQLAAYKTDLLAITNTVTSLNAAATWSIPRSNNSAINQVRTNEAIFGIPFSHTQLYNTNTPNVPWEMREFRLSPPLSGASLVHDTIKNTPDKNTFSYIQNGGYNNNLSSYIDLNITSIIFGKHLVPEKFPAGSLTPFLGASVQYQKPFNIHMAWLNGNYGSANEPPWFNPICTPINPQSPNCMQSEIRHRFALKTCDGCHSVETNTDFTHVFFNPPNTAPLPPPPYPVKLSDFLTGAGPNVGDAIEDLNVDQNDPPPPPPYTIERKFNDLQRRGQVLQGIATQSCSPRSIATFATHQASLRVIH